MITWAPAADEKRKTMKMKKILALLTATLCCMALLSACGETAAADPAYKVRIVDALGTPYTSGMVVKFMQNGAQAGMQIVNGDGVAEKVLPKGEYTVELQFTDSDINYVYDQSQMNLSADKTEMEIVLSYGLGEQSQSLFVTDRDYEAFYVSTGCTAIELNSQKMSYFLFAPTEAGTYEFSLQGSDAAIGYYGGPHFVQQTSAAEVVDNKFTISVRQDMIGTGNTGTTVMVLGVAAGEGNGILCIQRIGDPKWSEADEPWTVYEATGPMTAYTHDASKQLKDFDLTAASYTLVLGDDGYYHKDTADGPLVLVRLGKNSGGSQYLDDFQTILEHSGVNKYFYDENGEFVKKERYDDCLLKYFEIMDEKTGLYPLTEDLKYIIQSRGEHSGWFDANESLYLFQDENGNKIPGINSEISWLFICCYAE